MNDTHIDTTTISPEHLPSSAADRIAYVKTVRFEDVQKQFRRCRELAPGTLLYALPRGRRHADHADGQPANRQLRCA